MVLRSYERKFRTCEHVCENSFRKTLRMVLRSYERKFRTCEPGLILVENASLVYSPQLGVEGEFKHFIERQYLVLV